MCLFSWRFSQLHLPSILFARGLSYSWFFLSPLFTLSSAPCQLLLPSLPLSLPSIHWSISSLTDINYGLLVCYLFLGFLLLPPVSLFLLSFFSFHIGFLVFWVRLSNTWGYFWDIHIWEQHAENLKALCFCFFHLIEFLYNDWPPLWDTQILSTHESFYGS